MPVAEGNFLFEVSSMIYFDGNERGLFFNLGGSNSRFLFTDDYIIAGDVCFGIHCYDKEGTFLYTIESNEFPKVYDASKNSISFSAGDIKGFYGRITAHGNNCLYSVREDNKSMLCLYDLTREKRIMTRPFEGRALSVDNTSMANYVYELTDTVTGNFLFTSDLKGDTLCRFPNYNPLPEIKKNASSYNSPPSPDIYYYGGRLTLRQSMNDTVYRIAAPNRLIPAYVLNFGLYRIDVQTYLYGNQSGKLLAYTWKESDRYVLFIYTQDRDTPNNRKDGSVKFFYSYYDKKSRQFYHFSEGSTIAPEQFFMENPVPDALPFILSHADIQDNQLWVCYSKKRLEEISKNKGFASLSPEQQNKLKTLQNELDDSEVLIMILE